MLYIHFSDNGKPAQDRSKKGSTPKEAKESEVPFAAPLDKTQEESNKQTSASKESGEQKKEEGSPSPVAKDIDKKDEEEKVMMVGVIDDDVFMSMLSTRSVFAFDRIRFIVTC